MVMCNTSSVMQVAPAACPTTPAAVVSYSQGPSSIYQCNQGYPPPILPNGHILAAVPIVNGNSTSASSALTTESAPESSATNFYSCNGYYSSNLVPYSSNLVPLPQIVPYNAVVSQPVIPYNPKVASSNQGIQTTSVPNFVQCNQGIYTCPAPLPGSAIVPCGSRVLNGTPVVPCTPGICHLAPTAILQPGSLEVCPIQTPQMIPNPEIYRVTPPPAIPQNLCTAASAWKQSYGMEVVWQREFGILFSQYAPYVWMLIPVSEKPEGVWNECVDSAKVRFCCDGCGHGWTSMKGRVAFWFLLNHSNGFGYVCLKLYGQQCDRCKNRPSYEPAMWYPEEVKKVLINIYNKVGEVYYGFHQVPYQRDRRAGKPRTPHNSDLCQACKDGVCSERR
ncbi:uncharacterized protein LOC129980524 [Argiope bruennichi]|uniref:uncharacterized protein LOC129980524 n=1 Tax=Argiope bruennichi TaxID=94029 RepID=UPI0024954B2F|nr:uncharacterized protein LOC129980524 [Argiope bruennichi]XP_055946839.1 uncharacterized protein LOC129980524 [Argiope bruennichi]XP_055946841.1 uncharacterized protein LOC129980524 [Argiope bruennichi]